MMAESPAVVLESMINVAEIGTEMKTSKEKLEQGSLVFDLRYSKLNAAGGEPAYFSFYLGCCAKQTQPRVFQNGNGNRKGWGHYIVGASLYVLHKQGGMSCPLAVSRHFGPNAQFSNSNEAWGYKQFEKLETLLNQENGYLVNNNQLRLAVQIHSIEPANLSYEKLRIVQEIFTTGASIWETFFESEVGVDVSLIAQDGEKVMAHSGVLIAASPVFKDMLKTKPQEVKLGDVHTTGHAVRMSLKCIYTGSLSHLYGVDLKTLKGVIAFAEKFKLNALKEGSALLLVAHCCPRNVVHLLHFAKVSGLVETEQAVREYIKGNIDSVLEKSNWSKEDEE